MNKKQITNFAINLDENTLKQFENCYNENFVIKAALMPDAHNGYVAPIGSVLITKNVLIPSWVGYDIGCGMIAIELENMNLIEDIKKKSQLIYDLVNKKIPMGLGKLNHIQNISENTKKEFKKILLELKQKNYNHEIYKFIKNKGLSNLGTLGHGNHFIELGISSENKLYLVIHSGSRNIGHKIAEHYMKIASNEEQDFEKTSILNIATKEGKEYLNSVNFALNFALLNRIEMANQVRDILRDVLNKETIDFKLITNKTHNHVILIDESKNEMSQEFLHRKGATPAKKGEIGVIPANMRDGSFIVEGLGNKEFLESSSHGAGRLLSRGISKDKINLEDFKKSMQGIIGNISFETIDEAPQAYKNIYDVMQAQKKSVKIITQIKPIINWKG